ncbi:dipeptidase [Rufibacter roseus]|uniref:Dipeptidase n=1 Tax=Rufibacter roseus TaxID=1567108 RepID=A0ABW2DJB4_9BACT|nr:membrane dipeptidase [Rufibacter roseus]
MFPIVDLHCDLTGYLAWIPGATPMDVQRIGCAIPHLQAGQVRLQTMAFFTPTEPGSTEFTLKQAHIFRDTLLQPDSVFAPFSESQVKNRALPDDKIAIVAAIENASGLAEENEPLEKAFARLEEIIALAGPILYISFTHADENRFSGGNYTPGVGLKPDGEELLRYLSGKRIALDLAHTSDAAAHDMLNFIDQNNLHIPVIASHSNFRTVYDNPRNLPNELVQEVVRRKGLIGMNFLKKFTHPEQPEVLLEHISYGLEHAPQAVCFGADYFQEAEITGDWVSNFHEEHQNASKYPEILQRLSQRYSTAELADLSHQNALRFLERLWA